MILVIIVQDPIYMYVYVLVSMYIYIYICFDVYMCMCVLGCPRPQTRLWALYQRPGYCYFLSRWENFELSWRPCLVFLKQV